MAVCLLDGQDIFTIYIDHVVAPLLLGRPQCPLQCTCDGGRPLFVPVGDMVVTTTVTIAVTKPGGLMAVARLFTVPPIVNLSFNFFHRA